MSKNVTLTPAQMDELFSPRRIRQQAQKLFELTSRGQTHFVYKADRLKSTVEFVLKVIRDQYPDLNIPFHSRWGHFRAGGRDRNQELLKKMSNVDKMEVARSQLDLAITSVLLDAGAGMQWKFTEPETGFRIGRSEGLGLASFYLFTSGAMSSDRKSLRADREGLAKLSVQDISQAFQVTESNPLVGVSGRLELLNNLARALQNTEIFPGGRPGGMIDSLIARHGRRFQAEHVLRAVIDGLGPIWPGRLQSGTVNLGDVWVHSKLGSAGSYESLVPFHKLSQWMTYSLIEAMMVAGLKIDGVENLTGLAEYRNGGLILDSGLVQLKEASLAKQTWTPDSDLIIEWRALTVYLLDIMGEEIQKALGKTPQEFPLAKVLEGGTWWAGRRLAQEKRQDGGPPLQIQSDGTVF